MTDQYIALQAVQVSGENGKRTAIEPRGPNGKPSGLFSPADFGLNAKSVKRLLRMGAIRETEGTEHHEKVTRIDDLEDSRVIAGTVTHVEAAAPTVSPPDNDGDQKPGGSVDELDQLGVPALKKLAAKEKIDLGDAAKSAAIKKVIRDARAAKAATAEAADADAEDADAEDADADAEDADADAEESAAETLLDE